ncbi:MAG: hypothetical protein CL949_05310 [Erythrobacter sp.]|nr:hypothetical protein [Erythrobacter sp.]
MEKLDSTTALLWNARYASKSEIPFILKRPENRMRDVQYGIRTHNDQIEMELAVSPNGNMTVRVASKGFQLSGGQFETDDDLNVICWTETENPAVIRTELSRTHITDDLPPPTIVGAFLKAINVETHAICEGGYSQWRKKAELLCWNLALKHRQELEVNMTMSRTTCPGLENTRPWHMPIIDIVVVSEAESAVTFIGDQEFDQKINEHNAVCMPSASSLTLNTPFMVRKEHTETFQVSPTSLPWNS